MVDETGAGREAVSARFAQAPQELGWVEGILIADKQVVPSLIC